MPEVTSMVESTVTGYGEHFTAFIDLLGFSEASTGTDEFTRAKVLSLLLSLTMLRGEFEVRSTPQAGGTTTVVKPAISTFSDHIVISYPISQILETTGFDASQMALIILMNFNELVTRIATAALSIGFLIRGGATIGNLYHEGGVVFGEALVEAYHIESRTAIYPRVVISSKLCKLDNWMKWKKSALNKGEDGLYYVDLFPRLVFSSAPPGENWNENMKIWFSHVVQLIARNLKDLGTR